MSPKPPLFGWRVVVTRASGQQGELVSLLREKGAEPLEVPTIEILPPEDGGAALRAGLLALTEADWICLTSANALRAVLAEEAGRAACRRARLAVIGRASAGALERAGLSPELVPARADSEALAAALAAASEPSRVLLPQADRARPLLADSLEQAGFEVIRVTAYRTRTRPADPGLVPLLAQADAAVFTSPSTFEGFVSAYGRAALPPLVVSIGPVTSAALSAAGVEVAAEAESQRAAGLVAALESLAAAGAETTSK